MYPTLMGAPDTKLVHCPAARESCRPSSNRNGAALARHLESTFDVWRDLQTTGRIAELTFVTTNNPSAANDADFVRPLEEANGLWFCGGVQSSLADLFVDRTRPTAFQNAVLGILRRGGVVGGTSAGLAIMSEIMIEGNEDVDAGPAEAHLSRGLGVLKYVLAEQHFDARGGRIERLTGLLRDHKKLANFCPTCQPKRMLGIAVEETTAVLIQGNRLRVTGKGQAHVFLQSKDSRLMAWHALHRGDVAVMRQGPSGLILELEDWQFQE